MLYICCDLKKKILYFVLSHYYHRALAMEISQQEEDIFVEIGNYNLVFYREHQRKKRMTFIARNEAKRKRARTFTIKRNKQKQIENHNHDKQNSQTEKNILIFCSINNVYPIIIDALHLTFHMHFMKYYITNIRYHITSTLSMYHNQYRINNRSQLLLTVFSVINP